MAMTDGDNDRFARDDGLRGYRLLVVRFSNREQQIVAKCIYQDPSLVSCWSCAFDCIYSVVVYCRIDTPRNRGGQVWDGW